MTQKSRNLAHGALIAALYAALTYGQNLLLPGSASMAIQLRLSEALCVLAFFTPAAVPGLAVGCLLFNLTTAGTLPLDPLVGTAATAVAAFAMRRCRRIRLFGLPILGLLMPALTNGLLVGWELQLYLGGGFWLHAACVAAGEAIVLLTLGAALYTVLRKRQIGRYLFGQVG